MTAENAPPAGRTGGGENCFNEAAADDRGKPRAAARRRGSSPRFNEAAADDRGKHTATSAAVTTSARLQ